MAEETHVNFLIGSTETIVCSSSYPPPWTKSSNGKMQIIGVNGEKHLGFKETRYDFSSEGENYFIRISDVRLSDAGEFTCGSDSPTAFVVSVIR